MIFNLLVDEKIEVWKRTYVNVEANNLEESVKKYLDGDYEVTDNEILYDTERLLEPSYENNVTVEIYSQDSNKYEPIYTNDLYKQ